MGACFTTPVAAAPWPDLPPEIAGLILCRLPSHHDRLSFGAVCRSWRFAARQQCPLPPATPCINLGNGAYQSLLDGKVRRFPKAKRGYRVGASFGGWLFSYNAGSHGGRCFLRVQSSSSASAAIKVPTRYQKSWVDFPAAMDWAVGTLLDTVLIGPGTDMKMIVCSSDHVVALFRHPDDGHFRTITYLASFRPAAELQRRLRVSYFVVQPHEGQPKYFYRDISFFHGKLLALSCREELFCHDLSFAKGDTDSHLLPVVRRQEADAWQFMRCNCCLVVSSDKEKLLMVRWRRRGSDERSMDLWVFEADFAEARWVEVKDLGDQILLIGKDCSMAFATAESEHWGLMFRGGNRVFVLDAEWARSSGQPTVFDTPSYCVYDMASGETSMVSLEGTLSTEGSCTPGWFFPHE